MPSYSVRIVLKSQEITFSSFNVAEENAKVVAQGLGLAWAPNSMMRVTENGLLIEMVKKSDDPNQVE